MPETKKEAVQKAIEDLSHEAQKREVTPDEISKVVTENYKKGK